MPLNIYVHEKLMFEQAQEWRKEIELQQLLSERPRKERHPRIVRLYNLCLTAIMRRFAVKTRLIDHYTNSLSASGSHTQPL